MKKDVHFAALFPYNLVLISDNAPSSVNPSIDGVKLLVFTLVDYDAKFLMKYDKFQH